MPLFLWYNAYMRNIDHISKVLYDLDPIGTCCKENEAFDEYSKVADSIDLYFRAENAETASQKAACIVNAFDFWFYEGALSFTQALEIVTIIDQE